MKFSGKKRLKKKVYEGKKHVTIKCKCRSTFFEKEKEKGKKWGLNQANEVKNKKISKKYKRKK